MDWLTFISTSIQALAWPVAAVIIAILFRRQLRELLRRIKKGKVGSAEFEFESAVRELTYVEDRTRPSDIQFLSYNLADIDPSEARSTVLESWLEVEVTAKQLAGKLSEKPASAFRNPVTAMREIAKREAIDGHYISLFNELRHLRNKAAHEVDFCPSLNSVIGYMELAEDLKKALENAKTGH